MSLCEPTFHALLSIYVYSNVKYISLVSCLVEINLYNSNCWLQNITTRKHIHLALRNFGYLCCEYLVSNKCKKIYFFDFSCFWGERRGGHTPLLVSSGLLAHQYFYFFAPNSKCALEDTLSEKNQCGYRKWGTHALVFSQTLAHGNNKYKIR